MERTEQVLSSNGVPVLVAYMDRQTIALHPSEPYRMIAEQFDPVLPVDADFIHREQVWAFMQRMTGERMLEKIQKMICRALELGIETEEIDCPHPDRRPVSRPLAYLGHRLLFCAECHAQIMQEYAKMEILFQPKTLASST